MNQKIMIVGDSLTAGLLPMGAGMMERNKIWPALLADALARHYKPNTIDIFLDAIPGRTIKKPLLNLGLPIDVAMDNVHQIYQKHNDFNLLVVLLGSNDYFALDAYRQHTNELIDIPSQVAISLSRFLINLKNVFTDNYDENEYKTLILIPPVANTIDGELLKDLPEAFAKQFNGKGFALLNLQDVLMPHKEDQKNYDGIHFSVDQQQTIADAVKDEIIEKKLLKF